MNMRIIATISYCLGMGIISLLFLGIYLLGDIVNEFYWGIFVGVMLSIFSWVYLMRTWNPRSLTSKRINPRREKKQMWFALAILVIVRFLLVEYLENGWQLFAGAGYSWLLCTLGFAVVLAWFYK